MRGCGGGVEIGPSAGTGQPKVVKMQFGGPGLAEFADIPGDVRHGGGGHRGDVAADRDALGQRRAGRGDGVRT